MFQSLCTPAFLYLGFGLIHVVFTIFKSKIFTALKYFLSTILGTTILNYLCEKQLTFLSWLFILIPFLIFAIMVLLDKSKEMQQKRLEAEKEKADSLANDIRMNSDIILYHDHGPGSNHQHYKHGVGVDDNVRDLKDTVSINKINEYDLNNGFDLNNERRNYEFDFDTQYNGTNPMRFIRDQRLMSY